MLLVESTHLVVMLVHTILETWVLVIRSLFSMEEEWSIHLDTKQNY